MTPDEKIQLLREALEDVLDYYVDNGTRLDEVTDPTAGYEFTLAEKVRRALAATEPTPPTDMDE